MDNKKFYEQFDWKMLKYKHLKSKIEIIKQTIPSDVKKILDVGCGNGIITNELSKNYQVTGLDRSSEALKFVKNDKILASSDKIPFSINDFDIIFSSEMLEHLPDDIFRKTISEFKRISPKYIFISVPNNENLKKTFIECPKCNFRYNRSYHLRSFSINNICKLFPEYELKENFTFGVKIRKYNSLFLKIKQNLTPAISWIPYYWTSKEKRKTMCPRCEHQFIYDFKFNFISFVCDSINAIISPKIPYWIFVLLEKK
ncbi:MAG: class I SAM-dependent methyltransferase [Candidatus Cloacimonetes bacterium]|nr:class I SAM-dependent methyltransferase [Candidatus Cloacimonadota bacterium]